jgi:hypothetical protein
MMPESEKKQLQLVKTLGVFDDSEEIICNYETV